jgi:hypothetical protein
MAGEDPGQTKDRSRRIKKVGGKIVFENNYGYKLRVKS